MVIVKCRECYAGPMEINIPVGTKVEEYMCPECFSQTLEEYDKTKTT